MKSNITEQNWPNVKGEIKKTWVNLSSKELDETKGETGAVTNLLSQKCGLSHQDAERKLDDVIARCGTQASSFSKSADSKKMGDSEKRFENDGGRTTASSDKPQRDPGNRDAGTREQDSDEQAP